MLPAISLPLFILYCSLYNFFIYSKASFSEWIFFTSSLICCLWASLCAIKSFCSFILFTFSFVIWTSCPFSSCTINIPSSPNPTTLSPSLKLLAWIVTELSFSWDTPSILPEPSFNILPAEKNVSPIKDTAPILTANCVWKSWVTLCLNFAFSSLVNDLPNLFSFSLIFILVFLSIVLLNNPTFLWIFWFFFESFSIVLSSTFVKTIYIISHYIFKVNNFKKFVSF